MMLHDRKSRNRPEKKLGEYHLPIQSHSMSLETSYPPQQLLLPVPLLNCHLTSATTGKLLCESSRVAQAPILNPNLVALTKPSTAKRGKLVDSAAATDMLKGMEIDDQPVVIFVSDGFTVLPECEKGNDVPPTVSYAWVVFGSGLNTDGLRAELLTDASASVSKVFEDEIYGPWMLVKTRRR
ncbi:hypothetical protein V6N13_088580 [Hibiscus sabdariffa]